MAEYTQKAPSLRHTTDASTRTAVRHTNSSVERQLAASQLDTVQAGLNDGQRVQALARLQRALNWGPSVTQRAHFAAVLQRSRGNADAPSASQRPRTIQRVSMPDADQLASDAGTVPPKIHADWLALMSAVQRYHQYIDEYRRDQISRGSLDPALFYEYRDTMNSRIGVVRRHAQTVQALASERHRTLTGKLIKSGKNEAEIATLAVVMRVLTNVLTLVGQATLAADELRSLHPEIEAHFKILNQQNVDNFLLANPNKTLKATDLAVGSAQANVNAGAVNKVGLATYNPRLGGSGPIGTAITGYTKTGVDDSGREVVSDPGQTIGISVQDPRAALRAVATYRVSELIGLGIIPRTVLTQYTNEQGKERLGQVMEKAFGSTGQGKSGNIRTKVTDPVRKHELLRYIAVLKQPAGHIRAEQLQQAKDAIVGKFVEIRGELYEPFKEAVYNFDWTNPVLQRDLSTLQVFDLLVGHVDRHAGNYIVDYDPRDKNNIRGVKGIDNDDTFGKHFTNINDQTRAGQRLVARSDRNANKPISKTPNLPPVLDFHTALRLLNTNWNLIAAELATYTISPPEIAATKTRFDVIVRHVIDLAVSDRLASMGAVSHDDLVSMYFALERHGRHWRRDQATVMRWGPQTMALQDRSNSYAAEQQARVNFYQSAANDEDVVINEPQYRA